MAAGDRRLIAITGANGTIGYASVIYALRCGYRVRCIVRREDAVSTIKAGPSIQEHAGRVDYAVVPDITAAGAYDAALEGASYVVHVAGVWPTPNYHPDDEIYYPFVKSMENILSAAEKAGTVRRIVFTQAGAALVNPDDGDTLGTRMDKVINEFVPVNPYSASFRPPAASPHHAYSGAKAYCMSHLKSLRSSGNLPISVVQVIPGTVMGPCELITTASDASARMDRMAKALLFNAPRPRYAFGFVHVDDCAKVHINALDEVLIPDSEIPDWFIAAAASEKGKDGEEVWREAGNAVENDFADEVKRGVFLVGRGNGPINMPFAVDSRLTERILMGGGRIRGLAECVKEVGMWYKSLLEKKGEVP